MERRADTGVDINNRKESLLCGVSGSRRSVRGMTAALPCVIRLSDRVPLRRDVSPLHSAFERRWEATFIAFVYSCACR